MNASNPIGMNDLELIHQSQEGKPEAFEKLVKIHENKIYNLLLGMTGNRSEAHDIFQETFLNAWRGIKSFKGDSNFSTWLYRIAVNAALMKQRKKKLQTVPLDVPVIKGEKIYSQDLAVDWSTNPLATLENKELKKKLNEAMSLLPEKYRTVLILSDMQGMKNEDIGKIMNLSLPSVKSRLHRARLFLRDRLSAYFRRQ